MYRRYAIYYTPPDGALARFGAAWLGWDIARGVAVAQPDPSEVPALPRPLAQITGTPRRYGLHATLKPPFALAAGTDAAGLRHTFAAFCRSHPSVAAPGLDLVQMGRFLALVPRDPAPALNALAADTVREFDRFRAPLGAEELARRDNGHLTAAQQRNLRDWGYAHVMEAFRFHITLTGRLPRAEGARLRSVLAPYLAPLLPVPFGVDALSLAGEDAQGFFHLIERRALGA